MLDQYITLIAAAIGAAIALVGVFFTERGNTARLKIQLEDEAQKRKKEFLTDRGEELYELVNKWTHSMFAFVIIKQKVMEGKLGYDAGLKLALQQTEKDGWDFSRVTMLIEVYFSSLNDAYNDVASSQDKILDIILAHTEEYEAGKADEKKFAEQLRSEKEEMWSKVAVLKSLIVNQIRAIRTPKSAASAY